jgi:PAS domain S-box-containing protein
MSVPQNATVLQTETPRAMQKGPSLRVLAVEDERIVARHLGARLSKLGYEVTGLACSKGEALELVECTRPDLVLMDIQLNGIPEGIEAAVEIRERFAVPVVYLTAHSDFTTLERAKATEPFGYLLKPFEDRDLMVVIETAISRHRTEKRLHDSEERLRLAQRAGRVGVFDWDLATSEVLLTPELEEIYGIPVGSFEGTQRAWIEHFHPEDRAVFVQVLDAWMGSDKAEERWEHRIVSREGGIRWIESRATLYRNNAGRAIRILGTELDITDRKRMEEALREKERELQRSNVDLQAYAYTVSHDLQEPLRTITNYVQLLEQRCGPNRNESCQQFIPVVVQGTERMRDLLDGLLEFSRVGQDERPMMAVDCKVVLQDVLESLSVKIEETQAKISIDVLPTVQAWGGRLNQLFQNLIENALKYRKPDVLPEINIWAAVQGSDWVFAVKDNGIGFDMKYAENIFGVFKRLNPRRYEGTGIGLSVCKRIVERHRGRIWAESAPGIGTTFYFSIPVRSGIPGTDNGQTNGNES